MVEELIPIVMFIGMTIVLCVLFWFRYRSRNDMQQTFRAALDKGQELTPEVIDRLGHPKPAKDRDLRLAIIWLAIAAGLTLCGFAIPEDSGDALRGVLAGAAFPFSIGLGYLIMHKFTDRG